MVDNIKDYDYPFQMGKKGLHLEEIQIDNNPSENIRIASLLDNCTSGFDYENKPTALICFDWNVLFNFLKESANLKLQVIESDTFISTEKINLEILESKPYSLCIIEYKSNDNELKQNELTKVFIDISNFEYFQNKKIIVAFHLNSKITKKFRYNILYK